VSSQRFSSDAAFNDPLSPIDLDCIRDTLRYIESDLGAAPEHARLRAILATALAEVVRLESTTKASNKEHLGAARFVPLRP
jgi:hypothetical protein